MVIYKNTQITLSAGSLLSNLTIITTRIMNKYCITLKGCITNLNQLFNMSTHYSTLGHRRASAQNAIFVHYLIPSKSSLAAPPGMVSSQRSSAPCKTNHHHYWWRYTAMLAEPSTDIINYTKDTKKTKSMIPWKTNQRENTMDLTPADSKKSTDVFCDGCGGHGHPWDFFDFLAAWSKLWNTLPHWTLLTISSS